MSETSSDTKSVVVERELRHAPEKIWRALTQPALIEAWLMQNDFTPQVGRRFVLRTNPAPHWSGVINCDVLEVDPPARLAYTWRALGLETVVTWTLTPTKRGTRVRMEQSGFRRDQRANYGGAQVGWPRFIDALERTLAGLD